MFEGILRERWNKRGRRALKRALQRLSLKEKKSTKKKDQTMKRDNVNGPTRALETLLFKPDPILISSLEYYHKRLKFPFLSIKKMTLKRETYSMGWLILSSRNLKSLTK